MEDAVKRQVVNQLGRVLLIHQRDVVDNGLGYIDELVTFPFVVEGVEQVFRHGRVLPQGKGRGLTAGPDAQHDRIERFEGYVADDIILLFDLSRR